MDERDRLAARRWSTSVSTGTEAEGSLPPSSCGEGRGRDFREAEADDEATLPWDRCEEAASMLNGCRAGATACDGQEEHETITGTNEDDDASFGSVRAMQ
jgi:hypothetical protein